VRTWLFRIATNACIDQLRSRRRRPVALETDAHPATTGATSPAAVPWLEPFPDSLLVPTAEDQLIAREPCRAIPRPVVRWGNPYRTVVARAQIHHTKSEPTSRLGGGGSKKWGLSLLSTRAWGRPTALAQC
jgi:DNA-directed RNA polymerase specialized sigma24 family protein